MIVVRRARPEISIVIHTASRRDDIDFLRWPPLENDDLFGVTNVAQSGQRIEAQMLDIGYNLRALAMNLRTPEPTVQVIGATWFDGILIDYDHGYGWPDESEITVSQEIYRTLRFHISWWKYELSGLNWGGSDQYISCALYTREPRITRILQARPVTEIGRLSSNHNHEVDHLRPMKSRYRHHNVQRCTPCLQVMGFVSHEGIRDASYHCKMMQCANHWQYGSSRNHEAYHQYRGCLKHAHIKFGCC